MGKIIRHSIIENIPFWILAGISIAVGIISFVMPPKGEIDKSVLSFISWMFAFAALWTIFVAMIRGIDARVVHGKTTVELGDINNENTNQNEIDQHD